MTALAALFYAIASIAMAAIGYAMHLLSQRTRLRTQLRLADQQLEVTLRAVDNYRELVELHKVREAAVIRHARGLYEENNLLRAQLVAYSEPPRFGFVRAGDA